MSMLRLLGQNWWPFVLQGLAGSVGGLVRRLLSLRRDPLPRRAPGRVAAHRQWLAAAVIRLWLFLAPGEGALAVVGLLGVYALIQGAVLIGVGFKL
jgi:hypothetical protein